MASRRRRLQRSQSTLTSTSSHGSSISKSDITGADGSSGCLSNAYKPSSTISFLRLFDSFRRKPTENTKNDQLSQYPWKYSTWNPKRSKSMPNVEPQGKFVLHNQSLDERDGSSRKNFSWSETSGVKIIRSLSDLNQALGKNS